MSRVCIYCGTELVPTGRGGVCPSCKTGKNFLAELGLEAPQQRGQELVELHRKREEHRREHRKEAA